MIDVKSTITETAEQVADRIERLLEYIPADRLGVTTDCGLILLQRYIAVDKLHALVGRHRAGAQASRGLTRCRCWTCGARTAGTRSGRW